MVASQKKFVIYFILFLTLTKVLSATQQTKSHIFVVTENSRNTNSVLKSLVTSSQLQCTHRCKLQAGCQNINYNLKTKECELLGKETKDEKEMDEDHNKQHWLQASLKSIHQQCKYPDERNQINGHCLTVLLNHQNEMTLKPNLFATIPVWPASWKISFDIKPFDVVADYGSILHVTIDGDVGKYGDRIPGIWFNPNSARLAVFMDINGHTNVNIGGSDLFRDTWTSVEVEHAFQGNGQYLLSVKENGELIKSTINNDARQFKDVKVYLSDVWYAAAKVVIRNLRIIGYL